MSGNDTVLQCLYSRVWWKQPPKIHSPPAFSYQLTGKYPCHLELGIRKSVKDLKIKLETGSFRSFQINTFLYFFIVLSAYFILHLLCKLKNINFCKNVWILRIWWDTTEAWLFFASAHSRFLTQFCHLSVNILRFGLLHQGLFLLPCLSYFSSALKKF